MDGERRTDRGLFGCELPRFGAEILAGVGLRAAVALLKVSATGVDVTRG